MQLVLFGYAINGDPRQLPTAVVAHGQRPAGARVVRAAENTGYFRVAEVSDSRGRGLMAEGQVQFALVFPADFSRRLLRGEKPAMAVYADATDPAATGPAVAALQACPSWRWCTSWSARWPAARRAPRL
jgi:ABC-2 type transport system permease protein